MSGQTTDQLRDHALAAMAQRGLNNVEQLLEPVTREVYETVLGACRWFDEQGGRVGTGVLANEIRTRLERGAQPRRSVLDEQHAYGEQVIAWLREHFPEWNKDEGNRTHPAAAAAVIRLHHRHGKHALSAREHGAEIRRAVAEFDARYGLSAAEEGAR